ncbi:MAG: BrnA antitoxin family protein [Candidatus Margulisbacteria bacterium]|nr:BrnA antitoxin family protein [Candidatus Margulisiibacteriota bacterium]
MTAEEFDKKFEAGEDVFPYLDLNSVYHPNKVKRINVDIPAWMVKSLDREAVRLGVTRQSVVKFWLAERLGSAA